MTAMIESLEGLLVLRSFKSEQARNVLNFVDQLVNIIEQIQVENDSLKFVTNK
jgi:hypothetical protein